MHTTDIAQANPENGILAYLVNSSSVTLTFDLLTPKLNQFIFFPKCTTDKGLVKINQCTPWMS